MTVAQDLNQKQLFNAMDRALAMIMFDAEGNILWGNSNFSNVIGYSPEELKTMHHHSLCPNTFTNSPDYQVFWDNLRNNQEYHDKVRRVGKDGNILLLNAIYTPVLNEAGNVESIIKIATDITDQETVIKNSSDEFMALVEEMTAYTNEVHDAFQQIVSEMESLKSESVTVEENVEKIASMATFVKNIAAKSNVLGLNASIEAARAGEYGKGFAVVADEVRKMADTSKHSAEDISAQLTQVQHYVSTMTEMVNNVNQHINKNSESISELRTAYEQIVTTAENLSAINGY